MTTARFIAAAKDEMRERLTQDDETSAMAADFDYSRCTFSQYQDVDAPAAGRYRAIRERLDSGYHGSYSVRRQALQDQLLRAALQGIEGGRNAPWCVFTAGAMGSGKSHTFEHLVEKGIVRVLMLVVVNMLGVGQP